MKRIKLWFLNLILTSVSKLDYLWYHFINSNWYHSIRREYQTLNYGYSEYDEEPLPDFVEEIDGPMITDEDLKEITAADL